MQFIILKFITIFYLSICANFVNSILAFIANGIFGSSHSRVFLNIFHSLLGILGKFPWGWGLISSRAAGSMSIVLVKLGSFVGDSQACFLFYYLFCEGLFLGKLPLVAASYFLVHFSFLILNGRKVFWSALSAGGFLINICYCISCLLNINSALAV